MPPTANRTAALVWLTAATFVWGVSFPLIRMLHLQQGESNPWFLNGSLLFLRCLLAGVVLGLLRPAAFRGITRLEWRQALLLSFWGGLGLLFQAYGLADTNASTSAFLTQFYCVLLPLWACLRGRCWPTLRIVIATVLVVLGIGILSGLSLGNLQLNRGAWLTLVAAGLFTFQILTLEEPKYQANRSITVTLLMFFLLALLGLAVGAPAMKSTQEFVEAWGSPMCLSILAVLGLGCTLFSYLCMNRWQREVTAVEAGLIYCLEPVSTAVCSLFLPGWLSAWCGYPYANESVTPSLITGGGLVLLANVVLLVKGKSS
jgi:drug/metabolite transporter (DMT)-like permease